jgi:hypothetical protein
MRSRTACRNTSDSEDHFLAFKPCV